MIPKVIHYCWFGGKDLPASAKRCIKSWKKYLPDYEIKRWDESNFDVRAISYTQEAYAAKKYAFVSDYARYLILYNNGGVYFDTDVEVIESLDDLIIKGAYFGVESQGNDYITVNPGLGFTSEAGNEFLERMIKLYETSHFLNPDGSQCLTNIVQITTKELMANGLRNCKEIQECCGFFIYPKDYFCPVDYDTREIKITSNTRTIHHYAESWVSKSVRFKNWLSRVFGAGFISILVKAKRIILQ